MSSFRRRLMMQQGGSILPSECQAISYLQSSETQWIDTEHICLSNESILIDFEVLDFNKVTNVVAYGWRNKGSYTDTYQFYINASNSIEIKSMYGIKANQANTTIGNRNERIRLEINPTSQQIFVNGEIWNGLRGWTDQYGGNYSACLFTFNVLGTPNTSVIGNVRIYEYAIKKPNGEYVQHFIPIVDKNGVACMYDVANKKYYYNKGTGEFIKGQNIKL